MDEFLYINIPLYKMWKNSDEKYRVKYMLRNTKKDVAGLTPAGWRMLWRIHDLFEQFEYDRILRGEIAHVLGRPAGLASWDRKLLKRLIDAEFISCERVALSTYVDSVGFDAGRGARYEYSMDVERGFLLALIKDSIRNG